MAAAAASLRSSTNFDAALWLKMFAKARNGPEYRDMRFDVQLGTLEACKTFKYTLPGGEVVSLGSFESIAEDVKKTRLYDDLAEKPLDRKLDTPGREPQAVLRGRSSPTSSTRQTAAEASAGSPPASSATSELPRARAGKTTVSVVNGDCLEEAMRLREDGFNPVVLNMASPRRPGGGFMNGSGAQEENLFRRTNYVQHLADRDREFDPHRKWSYPLPEFGCVYSKNVLVFRSAEDKGYAFLPKPVPLSFVALAAYSKPQLDKNGEFTATYASKSKRKLRCMMLASLLEGHDSMVLSAWGCGAFSNPADKMAMLFKEVLQEEDIKNRFKHVSFAIFDDHNAVRKGNKEGNFRPFLRIFSDWPSSRM